MRVLILGRTESLLAAAERVEASSAHEIAAVITAPAAPEYSTGSDAFAALARRCGVPFLCTSRLDAEADALVAGTGAEIGVSVNWPAVITDPVGLAKMGILNAHFGDLPRYRGNATSNWALLQGERQIALTVHFMEAAELDSGAIVAQRQVVVEDRTTIADLNSAALELVPELFLTALDGLATGGLRPVEQGGSGVEPFRCYPRLPRDGRIEWTRSPAAVDVLVRSLVRPST